MRILPMETTFSARRGVPDARSLLDAAETLFAKGFGAVTTRAITGCGTAQ